MTSRKEMEQRREARAFRTPFRPVPAQEMNTGTPTAREKNITRI